MPSHQGQIAFPGGKVDRSVDRTAREAALREAHEEIGLEPRAVDVVAELDPMLTVATGFLVNPFVGIVGAGVELVAHPHEVVRVFDVGLDELLVPGVHHAEVWGSGPGSPHLIHFFELGDETVWGLTARILVDLLASVTGASVPAAGT
jgi:8-oxo-dGTP pyrophosphatase MutT (NUDIX family)